jgi:hypothetical protein
MAHIVVDGEARTFDPTPQTWGDLLDVLDQELVSTGRIVTAARLDDVDVPAFRESVETGRSLTAIASIEVDSGTPAALLERCLGEASEAVGELCSAALRVADSFRSHDLTAANSGLVDLAEGLKVLLTIIGAAGLALRVDLQHFSAEGVPVAARLAELAGYIEQAVSAQQAQDWLTVADILQYDIEPCLHRWRAVVDELRQGQVQGSRL